MKTLIGRLFLDSCFLSLLNIFIGKNSVGLSFQNSIQNKILPLVYLLITTTQKDILFTVFIVLSIYPLEDENSI
jgi:hypothetical protein